MKKIILFAFLLIPFSFFAQSEIETIVKEGVALHNAGKYEEAIATYKKGLAIDKKSSLIHYEIGYAYYANKEYKKAIKHMDKVIKNGGEYLKLAYSVKGSSYDVMGKPKDAIKVYESAIQEFPDDYLLHYNLALTQYNMGKTEAAEMNLIDAVSLNPTHGTSNYLLGVIKLNQGKRIESLLALHFFLLIEPDSDRSKGAVAMLDQLMGEGVEEKDDKNIEVNIGDMGLDDEFSSANMMLSLLAASRYTDENKDRTDQELFYQNTNSIFTVLTELKEDKKGIWWDLYVNFFSSLLESENLEAYCHFIRQMNSEVEVKWMKENEAKMNKLFDWLKS